MKNRDMDINKILKCCSGFEVLRKWLSLKQQGSHLEKFFYDNGITEICIYGMAELGHLLVDEMKNSSIKIRCGIDRAEKEENAIEIVNVKDAYRYKDVQAIVVTPVQYYSEIEKELRNKTEAYIICLEDIIDYCT